MVVAAAELVEGKAVDAPPPFVRRAVEGDVVRVELVLENCERLDLKDKIITGDAIFCQKSITAKIVESGGDYVFPIKDNQKTLRENVETAFEEPVFPPCPLR